MKLSTFEIQKLISIWLDSQESKDLISRYSDLETLREYDYRKYNYTDSQILEQVCQKLGFEEIGSFDQLSDKIHKLWKDENN